MAPVIARIQRSEREACKLLEVDRTSYRYEPRPREDGRFREEMVALAKQTPRHSYRRLGCCSGTARLEAESQAAAPALPG